MMETADIAGPVLPVPMLRRPSLISVVSPKGGVGRTLVAINVAARLAADANRRVVLVELDTQFGGLAPALGSAADTNLVDFADRVDSLSNDHIRQLLPVHPDGMAVLPGATSPVEGETLDAESITGVLDRLCEAYEWVVVDTAAHIDSVQVAALDAATDIVHVVDTSIGSIRATRDLVKLLTQLELTETPQWLVINRAADRLHGMHVADVENAVGMKPTAVLRASTRAAAAMNEGCLALLHGERRHFTGPVSRLVESIVADAADRASQSDLVAV